MKKFQRNDPCHCGSGKKYKKCCLEKDKRGESKSFLHEFVISEAIRFMFTNFDFEEEIKNAQEIYFKTQEREVIDMFDLDEGELQIMQEWILLDYLVNLNEIDDYEEDSIYFMDFFVDENVAALRDQEVEIACSLSNSVRSIFEVQEVKAGEGVLIKDIFTNEEIFITEAKLPLYFYKWDLICARPYFNQGTIRLSGPIMTVPSQVRDDLEKVYKKIKKDFKKHIGEKINEKDVLKIYGYFLTARVLFLQQQASEQVQNFTTKTGDKLMFCDINYRFVDYKKVHKFLTKNFQDASNEDDEFKIFLWLDKEKSIIGSFELGADFLKIFTKSREWKKKIEQKLKPIVKYLQLDSESEKSVEDFMNEKSKEKFDPDDLARTFNQESDQDLPPEVTEDVY